MGTPFSPFVYHRDATHKAIAEYLEGKGYVVFDVSSVKGLGFDMIVWAPMLLRWGTLEAKTPRKSRAKPGARKYSVANRPLSEPRLTESEQKARTLAPVAIAVSGEEAEQKMFGEWLSVVRSS